MANQVRPGALWVIGSLAAGALCVWLPRLFYPATAVDSHWHSRGGPFDTQLTLRLLVAHPAVFVVCIAIVAAMPHLAHAPRPELLSVLIGSVPLAWVFVMIDQAQIAPPSMVYVTRLGLLAALFGGVLGFAVSGPRSPMRRILQADTWSPAERRALLWCVGVGLLVLMFDVTPFKGVQHSSGLTWAALGLLVLDIALVMKGGKESRSLLKAFLVLTVCYPIAMLIVAGMFMSSRDITLLDCAEFITDFGLVSLVHWQCLRAVTDRLSRRGRDPSEADPSAAA